MTGRAAVTTWGELHTLWRAIDGYGGHPSVRTALKLMALLYPRPGELRMAAWAEFDLVNRIWTIPAARAKMRREHRKPLPNDAVSLLEELRTVAAHGPLPFSSQTASHRPISENTLNGALRRLGYTREQMTSHGFRATASTLLNQSGLWSPDAIERELGHVEGNAVRRAYNRANHWEERVRMADWWAVKLRET